jgi:hypothetical protein
MARSAATTVADYLAELPDDRRAVISAVRDLVVATCRQATRRRCAGG